jgi:hypothetical protein
MGKTPGLLLVCVCIIGCNRVNDSSNALDREALEMATSYFHSNWLACDDTWVHRSRRNSYDYFSEIKEPVIKMTDRRVGSSDVDVVNGFEYSAEFTLGSHFARRRPYDVFTKSFVWENWDDMKSGPCTKTDRSTQLQRQSST